MKRLIIPLIVFLLIIFEGVALDLLPSNDILKQFLIVPHWSYLFLMLVCIFYDTDETYYSIIYGAIFGLLIDIVYTGYLGIYMFVYPIGLYTTFLLRRLLTNNFTMTIFIYIFTIVIIECLLVFIFTIIDVTQITLLDFFELRLIPTIVANLISLVIMYPLFKKKLIVWGKEQIKEQHI